MLDKRINCDILVYWDKNFKRYIITDNIGNFIEFLDSDNYEQCKNCDVDYPSCNRCLGV